MRDGAVEELVVDFVEDFVEVEPLALGTGDMFTAASLTEEMQIAADVVLVEVEIVAFALIGGDGFAEELADEDIGERFEDGSGGGLEGVGDAEFEAAVFGLDEGVGVGEAAELDGENGERGTGADSAEDLLADFDWRRGLGGVVKAWKAQLAALDLHVS